MPLVYNIPWQVYTAFFLRVERGKLKPFSRCQNYLCFTPRSSDCYNTLFTHLKLNRWLCFNCESLLKKTVLQDKKRIHLVLDPCLNLSQLVSAQSPNLSVCLSYDFSSNKQKSMNFKELEIELYPVREYLQLSILLNKSCGLTMCMMWLEDIGYPTPLKLFVAQGFQQCDLTEALLQPPSTVKLTHLCHQVQPGPWEKIWRCHHVHATIDVIETLEKFSYLY